MKLETNYEFVKLMAEDSDDNSLLKNLYERLEKHRSSDFDPYTDIERKDNLNTLRIWI